MCQELCHGLEIDDIAVPAPMKVYSGRQRRRIRINEADPRKEQRGEAWLHLGWWVAQSFPDAWGREDCAWPPRWAPGGGRSMLTQRVGGREGVVGRSPVEVSLL